MIIVVLKLTATEWCSKIIKLLKNVFYLILLFWLWLNIVFREWYILRFYVLSVHLSIESRLVMSELTKLKGVVSAPPLQHWSDSRRNPALCVSSLFCFTGINPDCYKFDIYIYVYRVYKMSRECLTLDSLSKCGLV